MTRVTFRLPLDPTHHFTPEALAQIAEQITGKPITVASGGAPAERGRATDKRVGTVLTAAVDGEDVVCTGEVDGTLADLIGGYGIDAIGHMELVGEPPERIIDRVTRANVVGVPPSMLPPGARAPEN